MKKYFIIIGVLVVIMIISIVFFIKTVFPVLFTEGRHYKDFDTGVYAQVNPDESLPNTRGYDQLIINGKEYSLIYDGFGSFYHASKDAKLLKPFANFGYEQQYTLYEVESDCDFSVYVDSKNSALFCERTDMDAFYEYYTDYTNFDFYSYFDEKDDEIKETNIDSDKFSNLLEKYGDNPHIDFVDYKKKDISWLTIVPVSKDKLYQDRQIDLYIMENNIYMHRSLGDIKLSDEDAEYFLQFFEQQKS